MRFCGRRWGVVDCDKDTHCYTCRKKAIKEKKLRAINKSLKK